MRWLTSKRKQLATIAAFSLLCVMLIALIITLISIASLKSRRQELLQKLLEIEQAQEQAEAELEFRKSPDYIEKYAREKLNMIEKNEKVYEPN